MRNLGECHLYPEHRSWVPHPQLSEGFDSAASLQAETAGYFFLGLDFVLDPDFMARFRWTASRTRALRAGSLIFSFSWMSMARRMLPSRLELKSLAGSLSAAPLAEVSLTAAL